MTEVPARNAALRWAVTGASVWRLGRRVDTADTGEGLCWPDTRLVIS